MNEPTDYRSRIYASYVRHKTAVESPPGVGAAHSGYRLARRWLPADRTTPVLELGCGPGHFLAGLAIEGFTSLAGVDLSAEQLELARRNVPSADLNQSDALAVLRRNPGRFGLIAAFDVFEHLTKVELLELADAIGAALRPGGRLIVQTPNAESPWGMAVRYGDLTHEVAFDARSLRHLLSLAGLERFEARECGPYAHGVLSAGRTVAWGAIRLILKLWNLAEIGSTGSGIYTRVFIATAVKPGRE